MTKRSWRTMALVAGAVLVLAGAAAAQLNPVERVGLMLYKDVDLSFYENQSCKTCHHPSAGFADPANRLDPANSVVSVGSDGSSVGGRNAPSAAYAGFSPVLHQDEEGNWIGGMFWDGRATGETLGDPLAEQAQGPFLNPVEMAMPEKASVVQAVRDSSYAGLFLKAFGPDSLDDVDAAYDHIGRAIAAYERTSDVTRFSSPFDEFWRACKAAGIDASAIDVTTDPTALPQGILSAGQLKGLALFNDPAKGNCAACHLTTDHVDANGTVHPPLFTDYTYDNLGIPKSTHPDLIANPVDYGLGTVVGASEDGKFKVPTVRNAAKTAPYGHNGYFATLEEIVNFYNTRDLPEAAWDPPEVLDNVNREELGDLGLTPAEEAHIVAFMKSLTDR